MDGTGTLEPICGEIMVAEDKQNKNVLNLASFRKQVRDETKKREKSAKDSQIAANRVKFGRKGAEKKRGKVLAEREKKLHEGHFRENPAKKDDTSSET